jgi:methylenetetrahydrofolate reductase (NADPH)
MTKRRPYPIDRPRVSFEFFPPKTPEMEQALWHAVQKLEPLRPSFVSVTYGAGGTTRARTHATVVRIVRETNLHVAGHLTCVAASRDEVDDVIRRYWEVGVRHIVALRGDPVTGPGTTYAPHPHGYPTSADLVAGIKACGDFEVSVGCYPEVHPEAASPQADLDMLKRKVDAGADRAITQFFFEADVFFRFLERVRASGIKIPVVPGIMPIGDFGNVKRFAKRIRAHVPAWLSERFEGLEGDPETQGFVGASCAAELCFRLREGGIDDLHFYTLNRPELTEATCRMLGIRSNDASAVTEVPSP